MSRFLALAACCAFLAAPTALAAKIGDPGTSRGPNGAPPPGSWAQSHIRYVVAHGLMAKTVAAFRAGDSLTQGELAALVSGLTDQPATATTNTSAPVTVAQLDARLVRALQLSDAATAFADVARGAGLAVPSRFGTESVARLLGLRTNHPSKQDDLELLPSDPVTRAETAFSVSKILRFRGWEHGYAQDAAAAFTLAKLAPGDVLFFGPSGPRSQAPSIGHTGIYLGSGWMIHSSGQGVAVSPLTGWYRQQFAWGRRPLAEAGLTISG